MSRKGKLPIEIPHGVEVKLAGDLLKVKGPKGSIERKIPDFIDIKQEKALLTVELKEGSEDKGSFHGLYRALIQNMISGVVQGFEKLLEMVGVGYRAAVQGKFLDLQLGFSHPVKLPIPEGLQVSVEKNTMITVKGINKHTVGQFAAVVRAKRPPEPFQGKGIRYSGEYVRKKAGKAAAKK